MHLETMCYYFLNLFRIDANISGAFLSLFHFFIKKNPKSKWLIWVKMRNKGMFEQQIEIFQAEMRVICRSKKINQCLPIT